MTLVGAGGNIGSHLVPQLARLADLKRVVLIDMDAYESSNLMSQDIRPGDKGRRKAAVQARRLRRIRPELTVVAIDAPVETVPLGKLRSDVVLTALDSRRSRQHVNEAVWRLGALWIDAGVDAGKLLARISMFMPGPRQPCLECTWDDRDYAQLEQRYSCHPADHHQFSTNAPSALGALAAALTTLECRKLLGGERGPDLFGRHILVDAAHHGTDVTAFRRNADCRLVDHSPWRIRRLDRAPSQLTIAEALELRVVDGDGVAGIRVEGSSFVTRLTCSRCGKVERLLRSLVSLQAGARRCRCCGGALIAGAFDLLERLEAPHLTAWSSRRTLRSIGLRSGDVISVGTPDRESHYELANEPTRTAQLRSAVRGNDGRQDSAELS